jgi:hypothetical protein
MLPHHDAAACGRRARKLNIKCALFPAFMFVAMLLPIVFARTSWWRDGGTGTASSTSSSSPPRTGPPLVTYVLTFLYPLRAILIVAIVFALAVRRSSRGTVPNRQYEDMVDPEGVTAQQFRNSRHTAFHASLRQQAILDGEDVTASAKRRNANRESQEKCRNQRRVMDERAAMLEEAEYLKKIDGKNTASRDVQRFYYAMRNEADMEACKVRNTAGTFDLLF